MASLFPFKMGLKLMGLGFKFSKKFREEIYIPKISYRFNKRIQISTRDGKANIYIEYKDGKMRSGGGKIDDPDITLVYRNTEIMAEAWTASPEDSLGMLLTGDLYYTGNLSCLAKFSYLSTIFPKAPKKIPSLAFPSATKVTEEREAKKILTNIVLTEMVDCVKYLPDPYLGEYQLSDFPSLVHLKNRLFSEHPWICSERAKLVTEFYMAEGLDATSEGKPWNPSLRQGLALKYLLSKKKAIIWDDDILPGTTTSKRVGVPIYPELGGIAMWAELATCQSRDMNPYHISQESKDDLNKFAFPYFMDRNVREQARTQFGNPKCQQLEEYFSIYFAWKAHGISHTIPDFQKLLGKGISHLLGEIDVVANGTEDPTKLAFYSGMKHTFDGVLIYATHLKEEAQKQLRDLDPSSNSDRIYNLTQMVASLENVPANPAQSFREAVTSIWVIWLCLHQENHNAGLSLGRLDQILYPYFEMDMGLATTDQARRQVTEDALELVGAFYLKCQDHLPLVPDVGNKLFGGSSSDQALTVGGITPEGDNAVNDLTYLFLKVTEILCLRDPNVNARFHPEKNSPQYLQRLCEVNINTTATPSIHNDQIIIDILEKYGFSAEDARNWAATGCVEPTSIGKHFGHTGSLMVNIVSPIEFLINNGYHSLIHNRVGKETGEFSLTTFPTFESLIDGYKTQLAFLLASTVEYNNNLGIIHQQLHPTPLLSALFDGPLEKGKDVVNGGAKYNSTGTTMIGLTDVVDSLIVLKKLVYDQKKYSLHDFKNAIKRNFTGPKDQILLAHIKKIPKFGSNDKDTNAFAQEIMDFISTENAKYTNYRGGKYFTGYWSMSQHVAFGKLSAALPSGRLESKAFTPGLTPSHGSSDQLVENIKSVAQLDFSNTPDNVAFNIKLIPGVNDSHEEAVDQFEGYTRSYFDLGGMQLQFNVVSSDTLRDAMVHPEQYRWLMVRISGYNAYFITLNKETQIELIERFEFKI